MSVDNESLKRVLLHIKGAAKGFKRDQLRARLKSPEEADPSNPMDAEPDPLDPNEPAEIAAGEPPEDALAAPGADEDAKKKLEAIRRLIGGV